MTTLSPVTASPTAYSTPSEATSAPLLPIPASVSVATNTAKPKGKTPKPRKRVNTAEKRNQHNAIERARRETLNGKFLSLARLLPSLAASRRPSKSAIVNGSIDHLTFQRDQRLLASSLLRQLCAERDELLNEVNGWRKINGHALKDGRSAWTEQMDEIALVEKEVFGSFASMDENDDEEDGSNEASDSATAYGVTVAVANGLITPRSSTDLDATLNQQASVNSAPINAPRAVNVQSGNASGPTVGLNGINWSTDFTLGLNPAGSLDTMSFSEAMFADASNSSPLGSAHSAIVTPPAMSELMYTHTPSPASSNNLGPSSDATVNAQPVAPVSAATAMSNIAATPWTPEQFASMQQLVQQAQQAQYHQAQQAARQHQHQQHQAMPFNPITGNTFNAMFGDQIQLQSMMLNQPQQTPFNPATLPMQSDPNIQALMASAFPQHGKAGTLGPVSMQDIQKAVRLGMGMAGGANPTVGHAISNPWLGQLQQTSPVEGY